MKELGKGDPAKAISVCSEFAPQIAYRLSRENGWQVTRVGTRVRNPLLGLPDAWEQRVLAEFGQRTSQGEPLDNLVHSEIVSEPDGQYFRFMKPIIVQPPCLLCHGPKDQIPDSIRTMLKQYYPFDAATGYHAGDLREAVSIKEPIENQGNRLP